MTSRAFAQVDVFSTSALGGNPVAVVTEADGVSDASMAAFARWTNLSETTFVLRPTPSGLERGADYRLRIFTPGGELPFAGHPTLGSAHAWEQAGGTSRAGEAIVQECAAGLVPLRRAQGMLWFAAPPLVRCGPVAPADLAPALGYLGLGADDVVAAEWVDNGPGWMALLLASAEAVLAVRPDAAADPGAPVGIVGPHPDGGVAEGGGNGDQPAFEVRAFPGSGMGIAEDPVTGSLNASLGQWLIGSGRAPDRYVVAQGRVLGRSGRVHVERDDTHQPSDAPAVWVGGSTSTVVSGRVEL